MTAAFEATPTVLIIDDEPTVLSSLTRLLRPDGIRLLCAGSGDQALALLEECGESVSVVMTDYTMPGMDGADLLHAVSTRWPDITRILLTGNADMPAAARAVNEGHVSRLCTKPWRPDELRQAINEAIHQNTVIRENRRLRILADQQAVRLEHWNTRLETLVAERTSELSSANASLQRSLLDSVRLLVTFLEQRLPDQAARGREVARLSGRLAERAMLSAEDVRKIQVAAMIHDIGLLSLPESLSRRAPAELTHAGRLQWQQHAELGQKLLSNVERLGDMGLWIRHHHERYDGTGFPDRLGGAAIPFPARIMALASGYLDVARAPATVTQWLQQQYHVGEFDPDLIELLGAELRGERVRVKELAVLVADLKPGMVPADTIRATSGAIIISAGQALTAEVLERVQRFVVAGALEPLSVMLEDRAEDAAQPAEDAA
ncbi:MAG TPA: HD domain-containing phosphohydrolase [Chloroflexota bacterium]|nr:HD domain-containing phosphohydrolase [Chloroflexota bacterium]